MPDDTSGEIKGASMSVFFDTKAFTPPVFEEVEVPKGMEPPEPVDERVEVVDGFFDSLMIGDLHKRDPLPHEVYFSTITQLVAEENRWAYKGSLSMPPCSSPWFIQVFDHVLPMNEEHLELIKTWQKDNTH